ncbi:Bug family tripartite tricarboxylate transporter substrate binding protein [Roseococcus pinisoli]|uniref:Tripartite tricarboxylate transporter substrate binding protein n=1 Tax=Roseococcus pinisoli TaxID=2835040 RepID=A0ABS5QC88_9PROT|nr:tripartite tricarboxylate transporter substrate binding protein [Roseococcus pinisoli]MBS7811296.1 tripartite tricarboxylate transporter substrate binding protein [Roseococcus pinisoli]
MRKLRMTAGLVAFGMVMGIAGPGPLTQVAQAQSPVTMIVPYPPGGATDLMARLVQPELSAALGATVVIKNSAGANGTVGAMEMARSRPDGTTILFTTGTSLVLTPHTRGAPFRQDQFIPVCQTSAALVVMMTPQNSGLRTLQDVVARARQDAGAFPYASTGPGGTPHITMVSLERMTGISMNHIPFRGSGEVMQALAANQVQLFTDQGNLVRQYHLHPIAVFSETRRPEFPDTPTMRELGHDLVFTIWSGIYLPAGTPDAIVDRISEGCLRTMAAPAVVEGLRRMDMPIQARGRAEFSAFHAAEYERFGRLVEQFNLRVN